MSEQDLLGKGTRQKKNSVENCTEGSDPPPPTAKSVENLQKKIQKRLKKKHAFKMHFKAF